MAVSPDFRDFVLDQLSGIVPAQRRMFGGIGLFADGLMFGIFTGTDTLYLKADDALAAEFVALGAGPMSYTRAGKTRSMSYYAVPAEFLDDPEELTAWAQKASARRASRRCKKTEVRGG